MFKRPIQKTEDEEPIRRVPATRYSPDYKEGLSPEQVREHQEQGWSNRAVEAPRLCHFIRNESSRNVVFISISGRFA